MNFLVQQINGQAVHDLAWELLRCKECWNMLVLPFPEAGGKELFVMYGFTNLQKYPAMLSQTWFEIKRNIKP